MHHAIIINDKYLMFLNVFPNAVCMAANLSVEKRIILYLYRISQMVLFSLNIDIDVKYYLILFMHITSHYFL